MDRETQTEPVVITGYKSKLQDMLARDGLRDSTRNDIASLLDKQQIGTDDFCRCAQDLLAQADTEARRQEAVDAMVDYWERRSSDGKTDELPGSQKFDVPTDKLEQKLYDFEVTKWVDGQRQRKKLGLPPDQNDCQPQD